MVRILDGNQGQIQLIVTFKLTILGFQTLRRISLVKEIYTKNEIVYERNSLYEKVHSYDLRLANYLKLGVCRNFGLLGSLNLWKKWVAHCLKFVPLGPP